MSYTLSGKALSPIGIGTYGIGGLGHGNMEITEVGEDKVYIDALAYTLSHGSNFTELSMGYARGKTAILFKSGFEASGVSREDIFLTHSLYPRDIADLQDADAAVHEFQKIMGTVYADSTLMTQSFIVKFGVQPTYDLLHQLMDQKQTRYVSLSNASPDCIRFFHEEFGDRFHAHEGHLSFEVRAVQDKGVFDTCRDLGVAM